MKKSLHPAAVAAAVVVLVAILGLVFARFGSPDAPSASMADRMRIEINHNTVNAITGEPLTAGQLDAQRHQNEMVQRMKASGQDPRGQGTAPKLGPDAH